MAAAASLFAAASVPAIGGPPPPGRPECGTAQAKECKREENSAQLFALFG